MKKKGTKRRGRPPAKLTPEEMEAAERVAKLRVLLGAIHQELTNIRALARHLQTRQGVAIASHAEYAGSLLAYLDESLGAYVTVV